MAIKMGMGTRRQTLYSNSIWPREAANAIPSAGGRCAEPEGSAAINKNFNVNQNRNARVWGLIPDQQTP